jgi:hypothetical protein
MKINLKIILKLTQMKINFHIHETKLVNSSEWQSASIANIHSNETRTKKNHSNENHQSVQGRRWKLFKLIQIHSNSFKFFQIHSNSFKFTQIHSNSFKFFQIHSNSFKFTQIHSNSFTFIQIHSHSFKFIHIHSNLFKLIQIHSHSFKFILFRSTLIWSTPARRLSRSYPALHFSQVMRAFQLFEGKGPFK